MGAGHHLRDAFQAGLILRNANKLDALVESIERKWNGNPDHTGLLRLYAHACVVTGYAPTDGLQILAELWSSEPSNGYIIGDYAGALAWENRWADAEDLFQRGIKECKGVRSDRRALLEEYAKFLDRKGSHAEAHDKYRELVQKWPFVLHNYRRFVSSLLEAAGEARENRSHTVEQACEQEAQDILQKLLEIAPGDVWAADNLHRVQHRSY
jgi:tetratricopeptide (TPR) repeat protein